MFFTDDLNLRQAPMRGEKKKPVLLGRACIETGFPESELS